MVEIVKSLANKYRPRNFDEIIGQDHIVQILKAKAKNHTLGSQNYLFFGPRGTGKTSTARIFAKALNAKILDESGNPSPEDPIVKLIDSGMTLDYIEIDAASHTGVDNIREEILSKVDYPPTQLQKKIYVIDEVHMLSNSAFNALLKTIEEPKPHMCFILATTEINKVPDTIISRCQVYNFKKVEHNIILTHLEEIAKKENISYEQDALAMIADMSEGCVRDSVKYLDQVSILGSITSHHVSQFLGIASEKTIRDFFDLLRSEHTTQAFAFVDSIHHSGVDLYNFAKQLMGYIDAHLTEDTSFFIRVSEMVGQILSTIRYYPYPAVAYKLCIHRSFGDHMQTSTPPVQINAQQATPAPSSTSTVPQNTKPAPISSGSSDTSNPWKNDMEKLTEQFIAAIDRDGLKKNLADHVILEHTQGHDINIITTSKMAHMLLEKQDTLQYVENILHTICNEPVKVSVSFEKKEDYLHRKMS